MSPMLRMSRLKEESDVLARVTLAAICGTDVHIKHGGLPGIEPGSILGHEFVGVVRGGRVRCPAVPGRRS